MTSVPGTTWTDYYEPDPWCSDIGAALLRAAVDTDRVRTTPDGMWTADLGDGFRIVFGEDGTDDQGKQWWAAASYSPRNDDEPVTSNWNDLDAMVDHIASSMTAEEG